MGERCEHRLTYSSPGVEALLGYTPAQLLGMRSTDLIAGDRERAAALEARRGHCARQGRATTNSTDEDPELPGSCWYRRTFGSMQRVYELVGYEPGEAQQLRLELARKRRAAGAELHKPAQA